MSDGEVNLNLSLNGKDDVVDASYVFVTNTDAVANVSGTSEEDIHGTHVSLINSDSTHSSFPLNVESSPPSLEVELDVPVSTETHVDENPSQQNGSSVNAYAETHQTSPDQEQPVTISGALDSDSGSTVETPTTSEDDSKIAQVQVANDGLLDKSQQSLHPDLAQESISETETTVAAELLDSSQDTHQQNGFSEIASSLTSPSEISNSNVSPESGENFSGATVNNTVEISDVGNGVSSLASDLPTDDAVDASPETDTRESNEKSIDDPDSCHVEKEISAVIIDPETNFPANDGRSEPETRGASSGGEDQVSTDATDEFSSANGTQEYPSSQNMSCDQTNSGSDITTSVDHGSSLLDSQVAADDKPETGDAYPSAQSIRDEPSGDGISLKEEEEESGSAVDCKLDLEDVGNDVKSNCQEIEGVGEDQKDQTSSFPERDAEGQNVGVEVVKKPFYFLIRVPRYDDENLRVQIKLADEQVQERTKTRDAIRAKVQIERVSAKECADKVRAALTEERAARDVFKSKRQEMDSVQSVINKLKNAMSVEDIDGRIRSTEHMIEHETLPLKEEKQLIREIKQLKQYREQISSNMGKQDEVQEALDQKDQVEERLKGLKKELDVLRVELSKAEEVTQTARKEFNKENEKLNELVYQFKAADGIRQEAYAHLQSLKKQQYQKNKQFWSYKDDAKAAEKLALSGDKEQLQHLCVDEVERIMELWNRDDDFRREYVRSNTRSTLRRLRTLDGRSLGPDEEPPIIPVTVSSRVAKDNAVTLTSIPEQERENPPVQAKVVEQKKQEDKTKQPAKLTASLGSKSATIPDEDERKEEREEEARLSKEEEEVRRKAEEKRKEEEAAKLKQQLKLEEKVKAKEAMERKKRIAEKAQARAAIRAQKEAEEKEKEREKKARKKERKKTNGTTNESADQGGLSAAAVTCTPSSEIPIGPNEDETVTAATSKEKAVVKRPQIQKSKTKATMPAPLRNKGKKRMQSWIMWVSLALVLVLAFIFLANHKLLV